jgi:transcriptional regulator with XRE-family HTH domain
MRLSRYREVNRLTTGAFARLAGVAHSTVWRLERGLTVPQAATRAKISVATRGEVSEQELILEGSGLAAHGHAEEAA